MDESHETNSSAARESGEHELCIQCMTANAPGSHFCRRCGAPLSSFAATGPFEALFAEGHLYRRAAEQPRRLIVVVGIWLIFGFVGSTGALMAFTGWETGGRFGVVTGIALLVFSVVLIGKTTLNFRNARATKVEGND